MRPRPKVAQVAPDPQPAPATAAPDGAAPPPATTDPAPAAPVPDQPAAATPAAPAPAPAPAPAASPTPAAEGGAENLTDEELAALSEQGAKSEVITVTGSLIGRREIDSPSPVSVVDKEKLESAGVVNLGDVLQKIPAQGNALNAQNNNGGDGSTRINLRSLGPGRTLVLMNGRRIVPSGTGADPSVDFGTIPLAMIERVEVLKDGASAIYGSDAVAGVVNVITRSNFNGTEAAAYTATTQKGDGNTYDISFVTGHSNAKGNVMFAAGYQQQDAVMAGDRPFASKTYSYNFCTASAIADGSCVPAQTLSGSSSSLTGRINTMPANGPQLSIPGCTTQLCTATATGFRNYEPATDNAFGDNYNFQPLNYLFTPSKRVNLFSSGGYEITKNINAFFEGQFNSRKSTQQLAAEPVTLSSVGAVLSGESYYNPLKTDITDYRRRFAEFGPRTADQEVNTNRLVVGLKGSLPEDVPVVNNWKWEVSYDYGRSNSTQTNGGNLVVSHLKNALGPSYMDDAGNIVCGVRGGTPIAGCVPLDILTPNKVTPDMIKYLTFTGIQSGFNEQHTAQATMSGKLVDLPNHGDISLAIGTDYRHEQGGSQPDPLTSTGDTTGNASDPTGGSFHVFEGFTELSVVPLSGMEYLKWVEIDAAARGYSYNTFGSGVTGKISGLVRTVGGFALRGTFGSLFRAPNIPELYAGANDSFPLVEDPCDTDAPSGRAIKPVVAANCLANGVPAGSKFGTSQQRAKLSGTSTLTAEKGTVGTVGAVYEPLPGLDVTLDYWHININNAIQTLPVSQVLAQCYQKGDPKFCAQIQRNSAHEIDYVFDSVANVGALTTSGLDFSSAYQYQNEYGTFRHSIEGTYLFKYNLNTGREDTVLHGRGNYDLGVNPDLKFNIFTSWLHRSGLGAGFTARFVDSFAECENNLCNDPENGRRQVSKYATGDAYVNYAMKNGPGATRITVGMNNVVDAKPPVIYNGAALNADESAYDFMGRFLYVRLGEQF